jgi:hypothetical protein
MQSEPLMARRRTSLLEEFHARWLMPRVNVMTPFLVSHDPNDLTANGKVVASGDYFLTFSS